MRQIVATDTFDSSISASWDNGWADWNTLSWISGGHVQPTALSTVCAMRYNVGSWARRQWSRVTINALTINNPGVLGAGVLAVGGATDESCYTALVMGNSTVGARYWITERDAAFGETVLGSTGDRTTPAWTAGDTATLESDGAGELTLWTSEANVSSGVETKRLTVTDTTITTGNPVLYGQSITGADDSITQWDAGNLIAGFPPHRPHQYHRAHNQR